MSKIIQADLSKDSRKLTQFFNSHWQAGETYITPLFAKYDRDPQALFIERNDETIALLASCIANYGRGDLRLLGRLVVHTEHRGHQLGERLLSRFTGQLDENGEASGLSVDSTKEGLVDLYRAYGYTEGPNTHARSYGTLLFLDRLPANG